MHRPIHINNIDLYFPHKICFENFTETINYGDRIAIIGRNGCGKSTLMKILQGRKEPTNGNIHIANDIATGYIPQTINDFEYLSGGQRLNKMLTKALALRPDILLLDEPTNHLDQQNRQSLMRMLQGFSGTIIVVTHDTELIRNCINTLWHIDDGTIHVFSGNYDQYIDNIKLQHIQIKRELTNLKHQKQDMHNKRMKEQQRAAKSRSKGKQNIEKRKLTKMAGDLKAMKAQQSQGAKFKDIEHKTQKLQDRLSSLRLPEVIKPNFSINHSSFTNATLLQITDGSIGYIPNEPILSDINLTISNNDRIAIMGNNGSGKSTLLKAILGDKNIIKTGDWTTPNPSNIGYLDQHYDLLNQDQSVFDIISDAAPHWNHSEVRRHLNNFLFRKNEEISALVKTLSGGEKARLNLAQIAAFSPSLLILDEITNNLDLETKDHVIQTLRAYQGAIIIVSHDMDFLEEIEINERYCI